MKHYTDTIPVSLAEKLYEKGMPMITSVSISIVEDKPVVDKNGEQWYRPMFCEVFDWLMEKGWLVVIDREYDFAAEQVTERFEWAIEKVGCFSSQPDNGAGWCDTWHEAAEKAIEKALTLI